MCIAITKPAATKPDWAAYQNGFNANRDGWGFAVPDNGRVLIRKDLSTFADFRTAFEPYSDRDALIHFRIKSAGEISKRNCHPFRISQDMAMIHNGTIPIACNLIKAKSDTWHFVKQVLRPMHESDPRFCWNPGSQFIAEQYLGTNKVAYLTAAGEFCVWNKHLGTETDDGHWYSNGTFKPQTKLWPSSWYSKGSTGTSYIGRSYTADDFKWERDEPWYEIDEGKYSDDPLRQLLGIGASAEDYEAAQNCLSMGLTEELVLDLYQADPELLLTVAYYYEPLVQ